MEPMLTTSPPQHMFGLDQPDWYIFDKDPLEVARFVFQRTRYHDIIELYVDGKGRWAALVGGIEYASRPPANWLVGAYNRDASTIRIMEDLEMRLVEVRAARG